jgi:stearoyl-CoA desaturase (delta-9 desaturase)
MIAQSELEHAGIIVTGKPVTMNRALNAVSILFPFFGSLMIFFDWPRFAPTGTTLSIFAIFFVLQVIGIGLGLHRHFTHRAFQASPWLRAVLGVLGSSAFQGPIDRWVADHRRHHRFTDQPLDPHSPHWMNGAPPRWKWLGIANSHVLWLFYCPLTDPDRYAADIRRDPISRWCSRHYASLAGASLVVPALVGFSFGGAHEGLLCFLWAGCLRVTLLHHVTWSINSIGHSFGRQIPGSRDQSRDITLFSLLLFGEGYHSFHHANPNAAVNEPAHLDIGGLILRGLRGIGWVWDLRGVPDRA